MIASFTMLGRRWLICSVIFSVSVLVRVVSYISIMILRFYGDFIIKSSSFLIMESNASESSK